MSYISKFNGKVFVPREDGSIEEMLYSDYLCEYWNDETTTPAGVANRTQVRAILLSYNEDLLEYASCEEDLNPDFYATEEKQDEDGDVINEACRPEVKWGTFTWRGAHGNGPFKWNGDVYDTEEEATDSILESFENDFLTKSTNNPYCYNTIEEAFEAIASMWGVDVEVAMSIIRKMKIIDIAKQQREYDIRIEADRKYADFKNMSEKIIGEMLPKIEKLEGESYKETCSRFSAIIGTKINGRLFHEAIKKIRS